MRGINVCVLSVFGSDVPISNQSIIKRSHKPKFGE